MRKAALLVSIALVLLTRPALAQPLPAARPEQVGLSSERLGRVSQVLRQEIAKGKFPGAVALVARKGRIAYYQSFGVRDPETRAPMTRDSIFRIYSMTKPITSVAIMMTSDHLGPIGTSMRTPGYTFGLGFSVRKDAGLAGQAGSVGEYGWAGAGGTYFWIDPREQLVAILMTQAPGPSRLYYRQLFKKELVEQALID
jgi:CubicO group peptidase (beta-lactamase class C family)